MLNYHTTTNHYLLLLTTNYYYYYYYLLLLLLLLTISLPHLHVISVDRSMAPASSIYHPHQRSCSVLYWHIIEYSIGSMRGGDDY